ncbi:MAG: serine/threonine-protein kinase [Candidatus Hydrogenedentes bacterium]|nr:serine/threonine-protein kinase [Candidatus Hydrogenedentota bacterium]
MVSNSTGHASLIGSGFGGYEVQALIGRGAMGTVYLARDVALGRPVALKVLLGSLARNPSMVRGFYREAQAAAPLRHPGIVRVYAAGIEGGTPYIAMEYVAGEPLDRFLRRKGQVSWQAALYVGAQVAEALQCAHDAGIIHRDVKPANILLDRQGRVRLTDFGIARVRAAEQPGGEPTIIGTPQYMSPEQCAGADVSFRTDLYSLGVTLYQMMAGKPPFHADSPQALTRLIATQPAPRLNRILQDVPDDVARLVAHLLEKGPDQRPATARDVSQMIERLQLEDGGRSAVPKALAAYVREQAQDSPLRVLTPPPTKDKSKQPASTATTPTRRNVQTRTALACGIAFAMCAVVASVWMVSGAGPSAAPAPAIDTATFTQQPDGTLFASVPAPAFRAQRIGFAGHGPALLVEASGLPTTLAAGATGILAMRPEEQDCLSVAPPAGSPLAEGTSAAQAAPLALVSSVRAAASPSIMLGQRTGTDDTKASWLVFAQRWNEAAPALNPAAAFESAARAGIAGLVPHARAAHAVLRPDGGAVCMTIEREDGTNELLEQRVYVASAAQPMTAHGARIVPDSVQYAPAGDRVAYIREDDRGKQELWIAPANGAPNTLIAVGHFTGEPAFAPGGDRIAVAWSAARGDVPDLRVFSTTDGATLQRLGDATVGHDAWLPDGNGLVAAARGDNGIRQLRAVDLADPANGRSLTALADGVGPATAVSADGTWAAGIAAACDGVCVVFVRLDAPHDDRVASRMNSNSTGRGAA